MFPLVHEDLVQFDYASPDGFKDGDTFGLLFNFIDDKLEIHHNHQKAVETTLNGFKSVIPAISLKYDNIRIEMLKQKFY